ncbi:aldo/keto reductase [Actinomycetospora termitidis]|uniref:Aldo/keto reductase n=1 Tax=Actinomycetospora termitidis TaxID=3053470 RepID=A0ABT7MC06_9PSEU|nr:aldo/keto reductase [Actinomycetospora sp. Odt1-22]MDL5158197.1 aldo/keto reductase [Actinomycetospora sp. Odt1-22]
MSLPIIPLGDGLEVSALGFGGMALSDVYGTTDPDEGVRTLHAALDAGVTFIDTADVYGTPREGTSGPAGTNEELIARVLADRRDEVQLATKFGIAGSAADGITRGDRDYVRQACENSLRRLGVDTIDLYYMHRRQLDLPIAETVAAMAELVAEGKVRHLGLSEVTATELTEATTVHPIAAVQSEWSIWSRDIEANVVPRAAELGVGLVPYSPLGRGFLTGTITAERIAQTALSRSPRFSEHFDANQGVVEVVREVAGELDATAAQVALAWVYAQGAAFGVPTVPIPGTRSAQRVVENAGAVSLTLSDAQKARLDTAADLVRGGRNFSFSADDWISSGRE